MFPTNQIPSDLDLNRGKIMDGSYREMRRKKMQEICF